ncbi:chemotaxis protein CheW [Marinibacterium sp. SX1]|uniref:chemotaxis protein CheW n=1 Tax=Marinibacterium sp. SX1 TaxID=3388424 RepID=UPI003D169FAA
MVAPEDHGVPGIDDALAGEGAAVAPQAAAASAPEVIPADPASVTPDQDAAAAGLTDTTTPDDRPSRVQDTQAGAKSDAPMALIDLGAAKIAIDVTDLREVMPAPEKLQAFQSSAPGIVGCVALRGQVVPVADLGPLLGLPGRQPGDEPGVIVIIGNQSQAYGITARAALQIVQARDCAPQYITRDQTALVDRLLARLVLVDDEAIGVLDPHALPALGVPLSRSDRAQDPTREPTENFLLFETDGTRFCLPLSDIQATLPEASIDPSILRAGPSEGGIVHHGTERALLNLSRYLGMSTSGGGASRASAVLLERGEDRALALRADHVRDILSLTGGQIARMPSLLSNNPGVFRGVYTPTEGEETYILDGQALGCDPVLSSFGHLQHEVGEDPPEDNRSATVDLSERRTELALLVVAGVRCAIEVAVVEEIVSVSPRVAERWSNGMQYLGNITSRRGELIPTFSLAASLGHTAAAEAALPAIVVIRRNDEQIGLLVDEICALERMVVMSESKSDSGRILQPVKTEDNSLWEVVRADALPLYAM